MINNKAFLIIDILLAFLSLLGSFWIRFDFSLPSQFSHYLFSWSLILVTPHLIIFSINDLYSRIWRFTSLFDLFTIINSVLVSTLFGFVFILFKYGTTGYPRSVLLLYLILNLISICLSRISVRVYFSHFNRRKQNNPINIRKNIILIGAGKVGEKIAREIINSDNINYKIVGFLDDDPSKIGNRLHGIKVLGKISFLEHLKINFEEVLICIQSAKGFQMRKIVASCKAAGKVYKTVPSLEEMIDKNISITSIRDVSYVDLLGREEVKLDIPLIDNFIKGKRILITGSGGSIGSELLKQCLKFKPSEVICIDMAEDKIFRIQSKFNSFNPQIVIKPILANINNRSHLSKVFIDNKPQIVFHAAAYKHVPIQELHPWTAVETNIGGTKNLIELSDQHGVDKFVLVSTDKAVNPANIMGATKRVAEKLIQSISQNSPTTFLAVRFGNVLGSSGSAVPTFQEQINNGGPVTITHPEMTRYFMSIPEASQLILQCGSFGNDGEIYLLEMGKPVKIDSMARDLIKLSGFEPDIDIPIVYTGLRPGEKLYEELSHITELKRKTNHKKIMILEHENSKLQLWDNFKIEINNLLIDADSLDSEKIQYLLMKIVSTYNPRKKITSNIKFMENKEFSSGFSLKAKA